MSQATSATDSRPGTTGAGVAAVTEPDVPPTASSAPAGSHLTWTRADTVRTTIAVAIALILLGLSIWLYGQPNDSFGGSGASFALLAGAGLGILFERGRFCFFCIFRDFFEFQNSRGIYAVLTALLVGTLGYALVFVTRIADPTSGTLPQYAHIGPVGPALVIAGLAFGLGVVISGGCIGGHLYRLGEGSLRAIPALVGTMVGFGLGFLTWNPIHGALIDGAPAPWLPSAGGYTIAVLLQVSVLAAIGMFLLRWNPATRATPARTIDATEIRRLLFFTRWPALLTGALVGLIGAVAYFRNQPLGVTSQLSSLSRTVLDGLGVAPATLQGLDAGSRLRGCVAAVVETITNNGWLIIGIVAGSLAAALPGRRFSWEPVTVKSGATALFGGLLLGWGAIIGLGCTIGVFLSGTQAMALSGAVFAVSVVAALGVGFRLGLHRI